MGNTGSDLGWLLIWFWLAMLTISIAMVVVFFNTAGRIKQILAILEQVNRNMPSTSQLETTNAILVNGFNALAGDTSKKEGQ